MHIGQDSEDHLGFPTLVAWYRIVHAFPAITESGTFSWPCLLEVGMLLQTCGQCASDQYPGLLI